MIIIFGIVVFLAFIMESYVAVKMSEKMDALEEANSLLQQQINDFYGDQPISLDTNSICSYFSGYISDIKKDSYNINIDLILKNYQDNTTGMSSIDEKLNLTSGTYYLVVDGEGYKGNYNFKISFKSLAYLISFKLTNQIILFIATVD